MFQIYSTVRQLYLYFLSIKILNQIPTPGGLVVRIQQSLYISDSIPLQVIVKY